MITTLEFNELDLCEDVSLAKWLGLSCPTNIRKTIVKHREELESYGELLEMPTQIDCSGDAVGFWLNPDHALALTAISQAPRARLVRAEMIRRSAVDRSWTA
ncbi:MULTISPECIES: hypothetical protein [unclassified Bosea (in: a-proteobacteria)]|uniref:hypothetical protein n=1 Tax=unclassified Bosea (in: a-proteobacteria) TaxID=2653178 RepID=UPI000F7520AE|nr:MULTISPECIES: hypothetical protein [unclassified Bosea (in: a-proteobacteria)]AZO77215.1 hypothetical protein BLM15_06030 [Bosea sp. Tri-49]RXT22066.1 hypothetical protein B5U98_16685 [Bosea sp. Tri-39]RXT32408.1 hypothetical protein B5U99_27530 [Bosea sp. Tri-54]